MTWNGVVSQFAPAGEIQELGAVTTSEIFDWKRAESSSLAGLVVWDMLGNFALPDEFLREAHSKLQSDAPLLLTLPSTDSADATRDRRMWAPLARPYNWYFDRLNLQSLLFKAGFDRVSIWESSDLHRRPDGMPRVAVPAGGDLVVLAQKRARHERARLSLIVPVYNERQTFSQLMSQLIALELPEVEKEIIIVESNSTDGTRELVRSFEGSDNVRIIWQDRPRGKGFAVRTGLSYATGDFIIIQDADLEYDLNDYSILLEPLIRGREALVIGSRHATNGWKMRIFSDARVLASFFNVGHVFFTTLINLCFAQRLDDPFSMYKVFRRDCLHGLTFECNRFDFDFELLLKLIRKGYRPIEIPVNYRSRSFREGKKVSMTRDPLTWIAALWKCRTQSIDRFLTRPPVW